MGRMIFTIVRWMVVVMATLWLAPAAGAQAPRLPAPWDTSWLPPDSVASRDPITQEAVARAIDRILQGTPLEGTGATFRDYAYRYGVNPAFVLAIMRQETNFGKTGKYANNFGNIKCPAAQQDYGAAGCSNGFGVFNTREDGIRALFDLLAHDKNYQGCRMDSDPIRCVIIKYAPPSENLTARYISNVRQWVSQYQSQIQSGIRMEIRRYLGGKRSSLRSAMSKAGRSTPAYFDEHGSPCYFEGWCFRSGMNPFWYEVGRFDGWRWYPRVWRWCYGDTGWCIAAW